MVDDALQAPRGAVLRRVYFRHAVRLQLPHLFRHDHAAAPAEKPHVGRAPLFQQVNDIFEEFHVPALVAGHGDPLHVFLDRGADDLVHGAVVAQVDHLGAGLLEDAAEYIDRHVMAVEERGRGHDPHPVLRPVYLVFVFR